MNAFHYFLTSLVVLILTARIFEQAKKSGGATAYDISLIALGVWTILVLIVRGIAAVVG